MHAYTCIHVYVMVRHIHDHTPSEELEMLRLSYYTSIHHNSLKGCTVECPYLHVHVHVDTHEGTLKATSTDNYLHVYTKHA